MKKGWLDDRTGLAAPTSARKDHVVEAGKVRSSTPMIAAVERIRATPFPRETR
jgi:hypothetical protein